MHAKPQRERGKWRARQKAVVQIPYGTQCLFFVLPTISYLNWLKPLYYGRLIGFTQLQSALLRVGDAVGDPCSITLPRFVFQGSSLPTRQDVLLTTRSTSIRASTPLSCCSKTGSGVFTARLKLIAALGLRLQMKTQFRTAVAE